MWLEPLNEERGLAEKGLLGLERSPASREEGGGKITGAGDAALKLGQSVAAVWTFGSPQAQSQFLEMEVQPHPCHMPGARLHVLASQAPLPQFPHLQKGGNWPCPPRLCLGQQRSQGLVRCQGGEGPCASAHCPACPLGTGSGAGRGSGQGVPLNRTETWHAGEREREREIGEADDK